MAEHHSDTIQGFYNGPEVISDRACTCRTMSDHSARWDKGQWWCQSAWTITDTI